AFEKEQRDPPVAVAKPRQDSRDQSKKKTVRIRVVNPVVGHHWICLPVRNLSGEVNVRVLMIVNLLPTSIDVTKHVCRMEWINQKSDQAKTSRENNYAPDRWSK